MILERKDNEIVIRIPDDGRAFGAKELQNLINYIRYRQLVSRSIATQEDADQLAKEANSNWWAANKERILGR